MQKRLILRLRGNWKRLNIFLNGKRVSDQFQVQEFKRKGADIRARKIHEGGFSSTQSKEQQKGTSTVRGNKEMSNQ